MRRFLLGVFCVMLIVAMGTSSFAQEESTEIVHTVQSGENLFRIGLRYGVSVAAIAQANGIGNTNLIYVGQQLTIPGTTGGTPTDGGNTDGGSTDGGSTDGGTTTGGTYVVQTGDTLSSIARRFGTTYVVLAQANGIANPNLIFVGQQLTIPGGTGNTDGGTSGGNTDGGTTNPPPNTAPITGFEIGGHVLQGNYPYSDLMRGTGMGWAKRQIVWTQGTPASNFQGEIDAAKSRGFRILLSVVGDPAQLAANPTQYYQDFAAFLGGLAAGGADAIEVWNEPNIDREWPAGQVSGANYTQMLNTAYQVIKANNSATLVISAAPAPSGGLPNNTTTGWNDDAFIGQMAAAGAANFMDCVGIHYNAGTVSPTVSSGAPVGSSSHYSWYYQPMVNLYSGTFPGKPLCFTEIGYLTGEGLGELPGGFSWAAGNSLAEQAEWLAQAATLARNSGVVRLFIVWNVDSSNFGGADPQAGYAIVRPDGTCPACNTIAAALN